MTLLRSDRYASANTAHIMIVTMSGLHKAVPGQNELKRIRDQILIIHVCSSTTVLCSSHNAECIVCHFMFPITGLYCNLWINSPPDALLHLELRIYTVVAEFALLD